MMFPVAGDRAISPSAVVLDTNFVQFFRPRALAQHLFKVSRHFRGRDCGEKSGKKKNSDNKGTDDSFALCAGKYETHDGRECCRHESDP